MVGKKVTIEYAELTNQADEDLTALDITFALSDRNVSPEYSFKSLTDKATDEPPLEHNITDLSPFDGSILVRFNLKGT